MIAIGQPFPDFSLADQDGNIHTLSSFAGAPVVFYFYPKDDTSGCTTEACEFRNEIPNLGNIRVVGVSPDSVKSHRKFSDKYELNFTLLADPDKTLLEATGVWVEKSMYGKKYFGIERATFLIDKTGKLARVWRNVKVDGHAAEVLAAVRAL